MKKNIISLYCMLAMLLLAGCTREDDFQNEKPKGNHSLTAAIEGENGETRTAVDEKGNVTWIETDELGVFGNQNTQNARFRSTGSGANVTFTGNLSTPNEEPEWAYYPYSEQTTVTGQTLTFTLPAQYAYTGNSMAPMLGKRNGANQHLLFKHLCGVMRITINDLPADADRFVITSDGENAPYITGEATVEDIQKEYATLAINGEGGRNVTYQLNTLAAGDGFRSFFLPLPVGEYPKLSIALYAKDATEPYFTRTVSNLNVQRAKMIDMPVLDGTTGAQYVLNENTKEITEELAKKISTSESGNNTLTYAHAQKDEIPVVGNVVWSRVQEGFPQGFLGKVTEVISNNDGTHTIKTEAAALSEAFDVLYVNEVANLKPEEGKSTRATKNNNPYILFGIELTNHIEMESEYPDASLYMYAGADFGSQFKTYIELDNKNHIEFAQFTFINSFTTEGHISMNGQIGSEDDITLPLKEIKFKNIPMAYGLVQITPTITPYLAGRAVGNMENKVGFKTKIQHISGALFKNGTWKAGGNPNQRGENASPWKLESNMNFSGECYAGFGFGLNAKFYGRDDMRLSVVPEAGVKLSGEIDINQDNIQSLEQILSDSKLASSIGIQAKLEADASVISPTELQAELELFELELWKREVSLLPIFKKLFGTAKPKEDTSQTPESYEAEVKTEAGGATLMENTEVSFALENQETGEIEEITEPIAYNGDVEGEITENETPQDASIPMDVKFENLKKNTAYKVYPIIHSPIIEKYIENKKLELKQQAVDLDTNPGEKDILIAFYNATGGNNWKNNTNWCTEKPLNEWYGIKTDEQGKVVRIDLRFNNLTNQAILNGLTGLQEVYLQVNELTGINASKCSQLKELICNRNQLSVLDISGCFNLSELDCYKNLLTELNVTQFSKLESLACWDNQLTSLDVSKCPELRHFNCGYNELTTLDISENQKLTSLHCNSSQIASLDVSKCTNLQRLSCGNTKISSLDISKCNELRDLSIGIGQLTSIDLSHCPKLMELDCSSNQISSLDISNCPKLTYLHCSSNPLLTLDVSMCPELNDLECWQNQLSKLDVSNCQQLVRLQCSSNSLSNLDVSNHKKLQYLNCGFNPFTSLNLSGCESLKELNCVQPTASWIQSIDISECKNLKKAYLINSRFEKVYLSIESQSDWFENGGTYDPEKYQEPAHTNGYQYPQFIYQ